MNLVVQATFRLRVMDIDPSGRDGVWSGGRVSVPPRAMTVPIGLAQEAGAVPSRDTLVSTLRRPNRRRRR